jgi:hypothetical protein
MAALIIEDLVSRKWLATIVSVEETSTQVELAFTHALEAEGGLLGKPSGWPKPVPRPASARSATRWTTHSPSPKSGCSRPN